ncbi:MAG: hypothetical protein M3Y24_03920 [Acidobacteriota bacterium]|nr:hypothetical protein [Acidobacteriota bacterium]
MKILGQLCNLRALCVTTAVVACCSNAFAQQRYKITDLGVDNRKDNFSMVMGLNNHGWAENMDGFVNPPETSTSTTIARGRAVVSFYGFNIDLGTLGKPDGNSWDNYGGINDRGEAVGYSETADPDPNGEDVCGFGTHLTCVPFLWRDGHMSALPTLGGNNGQASAINNRGEVVGYAENGAVDPTCPDDKPNNRILLPALWKRGKAEALPLVGKDRDGYPQGINDEGQAVGFTGNCGAQTHAVMWKDNSAFRLQDLGGAGSNAAYAISSRGQIVGEVGIGDGAVFYAGVWQHGADGAVTKIDLVPGDFAGFATGINSRGQVVGNDFDSTYSWAHGFIWQDGVTTDLNTLISEDSNLYIIAASNINERGQISGMATVRSGPHEGEIRAYLLTPGDECIGKSVADVATTPPKITLPANFANQLLQRLGPGRFQR